MSREPDPFEREFDRRRFLLGAAGAYVVLAGGDALAADPGNVVPIQPIPGGPQKSLVVDVRRPQDFLSLRFELWNMQLDSSDPANPVVKRAQAGKASYLVVVFPPQNIAEEAFDEPAPEFNDNVNAGLQPPGSVRHRLAGGSRLAFQVPAGVAIPFTYAGLLGWTVLAPKLVPVATFVGRQIGVKAPKLAVPEEFETAIELPWRLLLSPNAQGKWEHAAEPVEHGGRTELWHTRLSGSDAARRIRAVWALDPSFPGSLNGQVPGDNDSPFPMSLTERDRASIVRNSSDWYSSALLQPEPVQSELLMLTALGGWLDARGVWDVQGGNDENIALEEWRHKATLGRDHYVRIVDKGFLFPFGHPAVVITIVERKIQSEQVLSPNVAYLRRRRFVVVRNPNRELGGVPGQPFDGRGFPFDHVRITTLVTPNLLPRIQTPYGGGLSAVAAWIPHVAAGQPFRFHGIGTDKTGKPHEFTTPLVFVDVNAALLQTSAIVEHYPTLDESLRMLDLSGQSVAIAPTDPQVEKPGDTDVEIDELLLGSELADSSVAEGQPPYFPTMESALVRLAAAEQASGGTVKPSIAYYEAYRITGFQGAGEVFAELTTDAGIDFRTDRSGGVIQPSFGISALSRKLGPTGGTPSTVDGGTVNPADFFGNTGKLLGGVLLQDILDDITDFAGSKALKLESRRFDDRLETELHWQPDLVSDTVPIFDTKGTATLDLNALIVTRLASPGDSEITVRGDLRNFAINLFGPSEPEGFVRIDVDRLAFTSLPNRSSGVDVAIRAVTFMGVLKFVQQLQELMPIGDGGSGPSIAVTPEGIEARFAVPIPSIQVGVFGISNIKFGAGVVIPFSGEAVVVDFNFSEREDMFNLQVAWFAGGGFFGIEIGAGYVKKVEAALEFGARLALDVGVASGMVEAMAGIYFSFGTDPATNVDTTVLTGYVRLRGELEVIEIVSLTITFDISLTYKVVGGNDKAIGQATVTVTIEVFVFSGDVTMTAERRFGKGSGDPTLGEQMSAPDWAGYASKFAPVPA